MIKYRLLQRKEKDTTTQNEYWFSIAIAIQRENGISVRQWGRIPRSGDAEKDEAKLAVNVAQQLIRIINELRNVSCV